MNTTYQTTQKCRITSSTITESSNKRNNYWYECNEMFVKYENESDIRPNSPYSKII